jgi:hypothetical protein
MRAQCGDPLTHWQSPLGIYTSLLSGELITGGTDFRPIVRRY